WPLVLRMSHQVALGINFLNSLSPPLLHLDLEAQQTCCWTPSLNTKSSQNFGLAKIYHSSSSASRADSAEGGTIDYMPPEAFQGDRYKPSKASDIYSYSILLWSILAWRRPYQCGLSSLVRLKVPQGQRPSLEELRSESRPEEEELPALIHLMKRCWDGQPSERPTSEECATEAERVFVRHRQEIVDAV
uniref:Protein kinase domain-containing protein n=1 Tax=Tetraodon nigroviridis TaxID=99883 RepID=H3C4J6_TETNG